MGDVEKGTLELSQPSHKPEGTSTFSLRYARNCSPGSGNWKGSSKLLSLSSLDAAVLFAGTGG